MTQATTPYRKGYYWLITEDRESIIYYDGRSVLEVGSTKSKNIDECDGEFHGPITSPGYGHSIIEAPGLEKPNDDNYNPDANYLRQVISQIKEPTLMHEGVPSQRKIARRLGIKEKTFRNYLNSDHSSNAPYAVQFALECLAN